MHPHFIDLHCDTLLLMQQENRTLNNAPGHINLEKLFKSGALLQCFAAFIPSQQTAERYGITESGWEYFLRLAALFQTETEKYPDKLLPVRTMADIERNRERGLVSAMLTVEDGACIEGDLNRLRHMYALGVRLVTLTWNYENCIGFPNSPDPDLHRKGLKKFGFETLAEMEKLGMIVDVSHLSEGGFWDVVRESKKPFVASHSCARALCDHNRNLTDEQLRTLGDRGGICGVNFYSRFLRRDAEYTENADILRHMDYIADHAGIEAVALGSDFDGIDCTLEMGDYGGMSNLEELIADRFGSSAAEKICHDNVLRVMAEVIG